MGGNVIKYPYFSDREQAFNSDGFHLYFTKNEIFLNSASETFI